MSAVLCDRDGYLGIIRLNRPRVFNAINQEVCDQLHIALQECESDKKVRAIILTGEGKAFCAGQDLAEVDAVGGLGLDKELSLGDMVRVRYNPLVQRLMRISKPTIAAVNGAAVGAGCSLALCCDIRLVTPSTRFAISFSKIGLVPDSGCSYTLPKLVGLGRALELAMTGRDVLGKEAVEIGLAHRLVENEEALPGAAFQMASSLAKGATQAISLTRQALYRGTECSLSEALELEASYQEQAGRTADFLEGVTAFASKREPVYQGK